MGTQKKPSPIDKTNTPGVAQGAALRRRREVLGNILHTSEDEGLIDRLAESACANRAGGSRRTVRLGFRRQQWPARLSSIGLRDIDIITGEETDTPVVGIDAETEARVHSALLRMTLLEFAHRLDVDLRRPPAWLPSEDQALADAVLLTEPDLYQMLAENLGGGPLGKSTSRTASHGGAPPCFKLPVLLAESGIALFGAQNHDSIFDIVIAPNEQLRKNFIEAVVVDSIENPMRGLMQLFDIQGSKADVADLQLCVQHVNEADAALQLGPINDVTTLVAFATSTDQLEWAQTTDHHTVAWLATANGELASPVRRIEVEHRAEEALYSFDVSPSIGTNELSACSVAVDFLRRTYTPTATSNG